MKPTRRLVFALLALALAAALALAVAPLRFVLPWLDGLLVLCVVVDFFLTPAPSKAEVRREAPARAGLSLPFARTLHVALPGAGGRRLAVHEEFPRSFLPVERTLAGSLQAVTPEHMAADPSGGADTAVPDADGRAEFVRRYRPALRGVHAFGDLRLFVRGPLGLIERSARFVDRQELRIEPALADLAHTLALAASERWQDLGLRRLRRRGGETEFESLRDYAPGDDVRRVDWKAFARRGKPMVRELELERGQELVLLVDRGRRMRAVAAHAEGVTWSKLDWALDAALQLAAVALAKGDRVGCAAFEARLESWVAPARGARQLQRLSRALFALQPTDGESDLERALLELAARHRRRATVVVLSDVADPLSAPRQRRALAAASKRHRVVFAALDDPDLRRASEPGASHSAAVRAAALELARDRERALKTLAGSGARVLDALPSELAGPLLAAWLDERRGGGRSRTAAMR